jgi:hypothetical protein
MERRVGLDSFKQIPKLSRMSIEGEGTWTVCEKYEIRGDEVVAAWSRPQVIKREGTWRSYQPIKEAPELFLRFAALHKAADFERAVLDWTHKFGVLGGDGADSFRSFETTPVKTYWHHSVQAWILLRMYEAWWSEDAGILRDLVAEYQDEPTGRHFTSYLVKRDLDSLRSTDDAVDLCVWRVSEIMERLCHMQVVPFSEKKGEVLRVTQLQSYWHFTNLIGAMYTQFYRLMTTSESLSHCEQCGLPMSLGRPRPGDRKRRTDKRFCNDACRQAHHRSKERSADGPS